MAWRIDESVVRGELDNRVRDIVTGRIWLIGLAEPVGIKLEGNCLRDLAGCRITFSNPAPKPGNLTGFSLVQKGACGDLTASRKCKVPTLPLKDIANWPKPVPFRWANIFYLEWFSQQNGRVVIEGVDYESMISLPKWRMTVQDEVEQRETNGRAILRFLNLLDGTHDETGLPED